MLTTPTSNGCVNEKLPFFSLRTYLVHFMHSSLHLSINPSIEKRDTPWTECGTIHIWHMHLLFVLHDAFCAHSLFKVILYLNPLNEHNFKCFCLVWTVVWVTGACGYFVSINHRLSAGYWWQTVELSVCVCVGVWPLSAVISVTLQWVPVTAELAWTLSHVLVRPLGGQATHLAIVSFYYLSLSLALSLALSIHNTVCSLHALTTHTFLRGPCDLPCLPWPAPASVKC